MSKCKSKACNPESLLRVSPEIVAGTQELVLTDEHFKLYRERFLDNINRGLGKATNPTAIVKCFPTYVQELPDNTEQGKYLALDLGGTNFRVVLIDIEGKNIDTEVKSYSLPQEILTAHGDNLFDFIAQCLADFVKEKGVADDNLPLGFCFSFPCTQTAINVGILRRWTKGFSCEGVEGKDAVKLLSDAVERRGDVKIDIVALVNDTTGTLMASAWSDPDTRVGLIIATGTNACYLETQENAECFDAPDTGSGKVVINLESGAFGDDGALDFCRTKYDIEVDKRTPNVNTQFHEKMISGMYLGELVRLVTERFTKEGYMFEGKGSEQLFTYDTFETKFISDILREPDGTTTAIKAICDSLGLQKATEQDYVNLKYICNLFTRRAAFLVSAELSVLIEKVGDKRVVIAIDGSLYKEHPIFHDLMMQKIRELLPDPSVEFKLVLAEDGSGIGAGLVAAVVARVSKKAAAT